MKIKAPAKSTKNQLNNYIFIRMTTTTIMKRKKSPTLTIKRTRAVGKTLRVKDLPAI